MEKSPRRYAPSFVLAVAIVVIAVAVGIWRFAFPANGVHGSERVVREFASDVAKQLGPLRRELRRQAESHPADAASLEDALEKLDRARDRAIEDVERLAEEASIEIEGMSGVSLRTQDNRLDRIDRRRREALQSIDAMVSEARRRLQPEAES